ncbi:GAF and ANTAR domain-containing protein [Modestobacter sp. L9-4]|uniref:GAF and ANTAR domain-containing protein n=1 Tax=Modestobacter sp. L9-4 TaxID=2851567 RepID=UPI001C786EAE|nr:GAF and ANTAR domain-containing protein [Modestobacter sp. L9-4]QXG75604.1 GAF and ANTAR domain-containing protein [Modestobacter sp. L9-4]
MNTREDLIADSFVELADSLVTGFEVTDFLDRLVLRAVGLLDADAAGIMLADAQGELQVLAASSHDVRLLELFELQGDSGPCLDSFRTGESVTPPDLAAMRASWPAFSARAEAAGYRSAQAVPMRLRDQVIGAMNVFRVTEGALVGSQLKLARALADVASVALIAERTISARAVVADQLQEALNSRVVIEQAKGMLAERTGIGVDEAFVQMRDHARRNGLPLRDVAAAVVEQRGRPPRR